LIKLSPVTLSDPVLLPDRIEGSGDLNPPAAQWVSDPLPATKVAGYIMSSFDTILGQKKQEVYRELLRVINIQSVVYGADSEIFLAKLTVLKFLSGNL